MLVAGTGEKSFSKLPFLSVHIRDVPDTTLPDTGFNRIVIYRIPDLTGL